MISVLSSRSLCILAALTATVSKTLAQAPGRIISELHSGLCVDVEGSSLTNDAGFMQSICNGGDQQEFFFKHIIGGYYEIKPVHSNKCMAIAGASKSAGAGVVQLPCSRAKPSMLWKVTGSGAKMQIVVMHTQMCLNINGGSQSVGGTLIQWPCGGSTSTNDRWRIESELNSKVSATLLPNEWTGPYSTPLVAVAAANLPDGKILMWSAYEKTSFGGSNGKTETSIFDPSTGKSTSRLIQNTEHDMFCPGTAVLPDGRVMITGGSSNSATTFYDPSKNTWTKGPNMNQGRGYHAMTVLNDGSVFTLGGSWSGGVGNKYGEVWAYDTNQWNKLIGIKAEGSIVTNDSGGRFRSDNHMWLFVAPNGNVFQAGPSRRTHWIFTSFLIMAVESQLRGDNDAMNGNAVMYDVGKILTLGGAPNYDTGDATRAAYIIDINVGTDLSKVTIKRTGDMVYKRAVVNSVVLPSGEVVVIGGQVRPILFTDIGAVYTAEIWNPRTGKFTELFTDMSTARPYHSVAILGKDGRVITAGGGLCGDCPANHADAEILTPPYLLSPTGALATRPVIRVAPSNAAPMTNITVTMNAADRGYTFALMRLSAATHSVNNDSRRIPLKIISNIGSTTFTLDLPGPSIAIPGTYFLFAMNGLGVPSVAATVVVKVNGRILSVRHSGLCLEIAKSSLDDGASVVQRICSDVATQQQFKFIQVGSYYSIVAGHSGKCLGVKGASMQAGGAIVQLPCNIKNQNQLWTVIGSGSDMQLKTRHSNMCLNVKDQSQRVDATMIQSPCLPLGTSKLWKLGE